MQTWVIRKERLNWELIIDDHEYLLAFRLYSVDIDNKLGYN